MSESGCVAEGKGHAVTDGQGVDVQLAIVSNMQER
jgi:hypothetical protein